jgi:hypothetical protein
LAASTIDRRLSTACGFFGFAHIDGRISWNPAQCVRRPTVHPRQRRGLDREELGRFLVTANRWATFLPFLRVRWFGGRVLFYIPRQSHMGQDPRLPKPVIAGWWDCHTSAGMGGAHPGRRMRQKG